MNRTHARFGKGRFLGSAIPLALVAAPFLSLSPTTAHAQAVSPPYLEDFESEPACNTGFSCLTCALGPSGWTNDSADGTDWTVDTGGTGSSNTGPSVDHNPGTSAGNYLYTEASGCSNQTANLISPPLDLVGATAPGVQFWYHMYGSDMGTMHVDILDASQNVLVTDAIPSFTANQDVWQQTPTIDLGAYIGQTVHIRIRGVTGPSFGSDMAVDDFELRDFIPDLTGDFGTFPRGIIPGSSGTGDLVLTNFGTITATTVESRVYISTDDQLDAGDILIGTATADLGNGDTTVPVNISVPAGTPVADYFLILEVDSSGLYNEPDETDNVVVGNQMFATGYDLQPIDATVLSMGGVNAGQPLDVQVTLQNNGALFAGGLDVELFGSTDQVIDTMDPVLGTANVTLTAAGNTEQFMATVTLPQLPPGAYFVGVRLDTSNSVTEASEVNNELLSMSSFDTGSDFEIASIAAPPGVSPGNTGQIATTIDSVAVPYTGPLDYELLLSEDATIDPMDISLGTFTVQFNGEPSITDTRDVLFPQTLPLEAFNVLGRVDPNDAIPEVDETANSGAAPDLTYTASDFTAASVNFSPSTAEIGDPITVSGTCNNDGLPFTGNVQYTVYLSPDDMWDPGDVPVHQGLVFFPGTASGAVNATFPLASLPGSPQLDVGSYRVILFCDSRQDVTETDEGNNWSAAGGTGTRLSIEGSDLIVTDFTAPDIVFIGLDFPVSIDLENDGVADAQNFNYSYRLSTNRIIRITDPGIGTYGPASIPSGSTASFEDTIAWTDVEAGAQPGTFTSTQCLYLGVIADVFSSVPETSESNNTRTYISPNSPDCTRFVFPIPDLTAQIINTATSAAAGEETAVTRLLINQGVAEAASFEYAYYLSGNPTITTDDIHLGTFQSSLATGQDDYGIDILQIPSSVANGNYYVGLIIDPQGVVDEVSEANNAVTGAQIPVFGAAIQFTTQTLPAGTVGVEYNVGVFASGGPLPITWAVQSGDLPPGLTLDTDSGIIAGEPEEEGLYEFVLRAQSGTAYSDKPFSIRITAPSVDLEVATAAVPTGIAGRDYETRLVAVGGQLPYTWEALSDLPDDIELSEGGVLFGIPRGAGNFPISVSVRDSLGNSASKTLTLNVVNAGSTVQIDQTALPTGEVGEDFCTNNDFSFEASGGVPPYSFSVVGAVPPGMTLETEDAQGIFCGVPTEAGAFPMTVRVQDSTGTFDTALFIFEVSDGRQLAISTFTLEDAQVGEAYSAPLSITNPDAPPYAWSVVEGAGQLPPGLTLSETGTITGTPEADGNYAFVVQVTDAQNRLDTQPLSIRVQPAADDDTGPGDDGCDCSASDAGSGDPWTSTLVLLGLGGLLFLRRRPSARSRPAGRTGAFGGAAKRGLFMKRTHAHSPARRLLRSVLPLTLLAVPLLSLSSPSTVRAQAVVPPYIEDFESESTCSTSCGSTCTLGPSGWTNAAGDDQDWTVDTGGTSSFNTGPDVDHNPGTSSGNYLYTEASGCSGNTANLISPPLDLTGVGAGARFWYHMWGDDMGTMHVDILDANQNVLVTDVIPSFTDNMDLWQQTPTIDLLPFLGQVVHIRIRGVTGPSFGSDMAVDDFELFSQDPGVELAAVSISPPEFGFLGALTEVPVSVQNLHGNPLGPFTVEVRAADNAMMNNSVAIGSRQVNLQPFQSFGFVMDTTPPASLGEGRVWMELVVDSNDVIAEVNESNNRLVGAEPTRLLLGLADLAVERVTVERTSITAGESMEVYTRVANQGGESVAGAPVQVMMSTNPVISRQDVRLGAFMVDLAPGETMNATTTVDIPAMTNSGVYYIGSLADPDRNIDELDEVNNGRAALRDITIAGGQLAVATTALPAGVVRQSYVGLLRAAGGAPPYQWEVTEGRLPDGIGLVPASGELFGRPSTAETQTFTVRVTSDDGQTAEAELTLRISDPSLPLTIVSRSLPPAVVGQEYGFALVITGGEAGADINWSAEGLPDGMAVTDAGVLAGSPEAVGTSTITVTADNGFETAMRELVFEVRDNTNLLIVPEELPTARFGEAYGFELETTGGVPPITFLTNEQSLPEGMTLSTRGELSGTPEEVGDFRFTVEARDSGAGGEAAVDSNSFELTVLDAEGFVIVTEELPGGVVDEGYDAAIAATGGQPPYDWTFEEGRLPAGLVSDVDENSGELLIAGAPEEAGVTNLLVQVRDAQNRTARRALSINVLEASEVPDDLPAPVEDDGCVCVRPAHSGAAGAVVWLGALGLVLVLRRRR